MATITEALALAIRRHQEGRLQEAEQLYRQILQADPNQAEATHLLGVMAHQVGRPDVAIEYLRRAIALKSGAPQFHSDLAKIYYSLGRLQEATLCYRRALELHPACAETQNNLGVACKDAGNLAEAVGCFRRALELKPDFAEAEINLGGSFAAQGKLEEAIGCFRRALQLRPDFVEAHLSLGNVWRDHGRLSDAIACFRQVLTLRPGFAEVYVNLGNALKAQGEQAEAIACFRRALELRPDLAGAARNLGLALMETARVEEAVASFRRALALQPQNAEAHVNLGAALGTQGKLEEAVGCLRRGLEINPDLAGAHGNLGLALMAQKMSEEAVGHFRRAAALQPDRAGTQNNLGVGYQELGMLDEAIACFRRAAALDPVFADAHNNLANALKDSGRLDEAIACYRHAIGLAPGNDAIHSNLINALLFHPAQDDASIGEEQRRWNRKFAEPLRALIRSHANERNPERRLRIGYVSPDFSDRVVGRNVLPILERHDRARFQVYCYASVVRPDALTDRFKAAVVWRDVTAVPNEAVAELIRADGIDILVDLSLHTAGQRLTVFARKPAPVQVSWAGYPGTTGLDAIDYRLTDPYLEPADAIDTAPSQESIRLPDSFWCYDPLTDSPTVNALPALSAGHITFGSLNYFCKINEGVISLWSRVLHAVNDSRLLLLSKEGGHRERALKDFERFGIAADRIDWFKPAPRAQYLAAYHRIDLGLDSVPYNGHSTSLDSFWMGAPVVTLVGSRVVGRAGLSQLTNLGLPELIGFSPEHFVRIAVGLAQDPARLSELRSTLRDRMRASPLMDAPRFTRNIEAAYREMWRRWCA